MSTYKSPTRQNNRNTYVIIPYVGIITTGNCEHGRISIYTYFLDTLKSFTLVLYLFALFPSQQYTIFIDHFIAARNTESVIY